MTIDKVWELLSQGKPVYWSNNSYKIYIESAIPENEYQQNHFSFKDGKVLSVRCISNHFGSILNESDLGNLFT